MKAVIQRSAGAEVIINKETVGKIDSGLTVLLGIGEEDTEKDCEYLAKKIAGLRIFEDSNNKMNLSVMEKSAQILIISNFTLYGETKHGFRPSFSKAMMPQRAEELYEHFILECAKYPYKKIQTGKFGAEMMLNLQNDGPITIIIDTKQN